MANRLLNTGLWDSQHEWKELSHVQLIHVRKRAGGGWKVSKSIYLKRTGSSVARGLLGAG